MAYANCLVVLVNGSFVHISLHLLIINPSHLINHFMCVHVLPQLDYILCFLFHISQTNDHGPSSLLKHSACCLLFFFSLLHNILAQDQLNIEIANRKVSKVPGYTFLRKANSCFYFIYLFIVQSHLHSLIPEDSSLCRQLPQIVKTI